MRRRTLLGTLVSGAAVGVSGCLGGDPVIDKQKSMRLEAHRGWVEEISGVDGSASLSYEVQSEDGPFWVFYFTDQADFQRYEQVTMGGESTSQTSSSNQPTGHDELSQFAIEDDDGVFRAAVPDGDGRHSLSIDGAHYFVVDHSNYGMGVEVPDSAEPLQLTVSLQVVDDYF